METEPVIILAAFDDRLEAEAALDELEQAGFDHDDVGFVLRGADVTRGGMITDATGTRDAEGAVKGMAAGSVIGGLLGAAAAATIPGVGPVLAGGILSAALGGAAAGAVTGGIFGALNGLGASEEEALLYQRAFESGKAIVMVRTDGRHELAAEILKRHGGYQAVPRH